MSRFITRLRTFGPSLVIAALAVSGVAAAAGFGPTTPPSSTASGAAPLNISATMQQKEGGFTARTIGVNNGFCIGASCITQWWSPPNGSCPVGEEVVFDASNTPSCTHTVNLTEPGACAGGFCSPTFPTAQAVCQANGYATANKFTAGYANSALSSKFCADYNFSTNQWGCDNSCTSSCHTMITSVSCSGTYSGASVGSGGADPTYDPNYYGGGGMGGGGIGEHAAIP